MAERDVSREIDAMKKDLESMRASFDKLFDRFEGGASEMTEGLKDRLAEGYEKTREYTHSVAERAREKVSERPLVSVATAFGVGLLVGKIMAWRSNGK